MKERENLHKKLTKEAEIVEWLWLVDLTYNFECDRLIELSDKLSDNNLTSELLESRSFLNQSQSRQL